MKDTAAAICPSCHREVPAGSTFCSWCGAALAAGTVPPPFSPPAPPVERPSPPGPATSPAAPSVLHRGRVFLIGETPDAYGVWDAISLGEVVLDERTPRGWEATWRRFSQLETAAAGPEPQSPSWRSAGAGWILLHILIGLAIGFGAVSLAVLVAAVAGGQGTALTPASWAVSAVSLLGALAGWILFVYLRTGLGLRWLWLGVATGVGFVTVLTAVLAFRSAG
jgi:zinc ribbon protein